MNHTDSPQPGAAPTLCHGLPDAGEGGSEFLRARSRRIAHAESRSRLPGMKPRLPAAEWLVRPCTTAPRRSLAGQFPVAAEKPER